MKKILAIAGAHRTGKSTLAAEVAKRHPDKFRFVATNVSEVLKGMGFSARSEMSFTERCVAQTAILHHIETLMKVVHDAPTGDEIVVFDRAPIDVIAYSMIPLINGGNEARDYIQAQREEALRITREYCLGVMVLAPGIEIVSDPTKAAPDPILIEIVHTIITGEALNMQSPFDKGAFDPAEEFARRTTVVALARRDMLDMDDRVNNVLGVVDAARANYEAVIANKLVGSGFHNAQ